MTDSTPVALPADDSTTVVVVEEHREDVVVVVSDVAVGVVREREESEEGAEPMPDVPEPVDPRLGRLPQFDERSRSFPMSAVLAAPEAKKYKPRSYTWEVPFHLDQGIDPSCVGCAWTHELAARPAVVEGLDYAYARWLYKTCQRYDEWSGESYAGTSVLAGAKIVRGRPPAIPEGRGLIDEYRWIFANLDDLVRTVGYFGPVIFGTWWYEGMFDPDAEGYLRPTGYRAGGHAYLIKAVDLDDERFRVHNSWGEQWGEGGDAWLSFEDALRLLREDGECCVPMRRRRLT